MWNAGHNYMDGLNGYPKDPDRGLYWLEQAFLHGKTEAGFRLYTFYAPNFSGPESIKDLTKSIYWLRKAADANHPQALAELGERMLDGAGVDKDPAKGMALLEKSLALGYNSALINIVSANEYGFGIPVNLDEAIRRQRQYIALGNSGAYELVNLLVKSAKATGTNRDAEIRAVFDESSNGSEKDSLTLLHLQMVEGGLMDNGDPKVAIALCHKLIDIGWSFLGEAHQTLADHAFCGLGMERDEKLAFEEYRKATKVKRYSGNFYSLDPIPALRYATLLDGRYGYRDAQGKFIPYDEPETVVKMLLPRLRDHAYTGAEDAQARIAVARALGRHPELVPKDTDYTVANLLRGVAADNPGMAMNLAFGLAAGWFGKPDLDEAAALANIASDAPDDDPAYWCARWMVESAKGDDPDAIERLQSVAAAGNWRAQAFLGEHLLNGTYMEKNPAKAESLLRQSLEYSDSPAEIENVLGVALWRGDLPPKRVPEGIAFMQKSFEAGCWMAGRNLAKIYHLGIGVEADETKAVAYLEKAASLGGRQSAAYVADAYEKGEIIHRDPAAAAKWQAASQTKPQTP